MSPLEETVGASLDVVPGKGRANAVNLTSSGGFCVADSSRAHCIPLEADVLDRFMRGLGDVIDKPTDPVFSLVVINTLMTAVLRIFSRLRY